MVCLVAADSARRGVPLSDMDFNRLGESASLESKRSPIHSVVRVSHSDDIDHEIAALIRRARRPLSPHWP
jgi:hypothetical protein